MNAERISCSYRETGGGGAIISNSARFMGETVGELTAGLSKVLSCEAAMARNEADERFRELKSRTEKLFVVLGRTCYRLFGRKKDFMKEEKVKSLIRRIKDCQKELREMEVKMDSWQEELKEEAR